MGFLLAYGAYRAAKWTGEGLAAFFVLMMAISFLTLAIYVLVALWLIDAAIYLYRRYHHA